MSNNWNIIVGSCITWGFGFHLHRGCHIIICPINSDNFNITATSTAPILVVRKVTVEQRPYSLLQTGFL